MFMANYSPATVPTPAASTVPRVIAQSPEVSERTTYKKLRRQLAFAPPSKQRRLLYEHLWRAAQALQRPISSHLLDAIMSLDSIKILAMFFSAKKSWTIGCAKGRLTSFFPEQGQASPHQELPIDGNHITPVSHRLEA